MDLGLTGKVALVTASSRGLGKGVAAELLREGCRVMLCGRDAQRLEQTAAELAPLGPGPVAFHVADTRDPAQIQALVATTNELLGPIDILVNNSGGPPAGNFESFDDAAFQAAYEQTLLSYIRLIRGVLPQMKGRGGVIINNSSSSVKQPIPGLHLSNVFRPAIAGLSKSLAEELAPLGIRVNLVAPGRIATDRVAEIDAGRAKSLGITPEEAQAQATRLIPLGRYGRTEEFARVVAFLASPAASYLTGACLIIDGGMLRAL